MVSGVDEVVSRRVEIAVQADEVALLEQFLELVDPADAQGLVHPLAEVRVVEDDVEPQGLGPEGRRGADPAAADEAQRLAAEPGRARGRSGNPTFPPGSPRGDGTSRRARASRNMIAWSATSSVP